MKIAILYYSKTGKTKRVAELINEGIQEESAIEVRLMTIDEIDYEFLKGAKAVILGTPTYYANFSYQVKEWFDKSWSCNLEGKLGAVFATADYVGGGADIALQTLISHMMVKGMLIYSGGSALGQPYIHLGMVALKDYDDNYKEKIKVFGKRIAAKALELFGID